MTLIVFGLTDEQTDRQKAICAVAADGTLSVLHVLVATSITGVLQSLIGGQPLLIVGVAEVGTEGGHDCN